MTTLLQLLDTEEHPLTIFGDKCHYILENEVKIQYLVLKRLAQAQK